MSDPLIFINTYALKEGSTDAYREACQEVVEMVRSEQPQMIYFAFYINEEGTEATTLQVHPDSDSMLRHMKLAEKHIEQSVGFIDFTRMEISLYGNPNSTVLETMRQLSGTGVPITLKSPVSTVNRLQTVPA
jgi:hypothetical protein